jgi:hypothetical protein
MPRASTAAATPADRSRLQEMRELISATLGDEAHGAEPEGGSIPAA